MLRASWGFCVLLAGCGTHDPSDPDDDVDLEPPLAPATCTTHVALDGSANAPDGNSTFGPVQLGAATLCLRLDTTNNYVVGHLAVETDSFDGPASPVSLVLKELDGTVLRAGSLVTVGETTPRTRTNLEWSLPAHQIRFVRLEVTVSGMAVPISVATALFEPLD